MRTFLAFACSLAVLSAAGNAHALDHLMRVNEVFLDNGSGAQFVEFRDTSSEPLPNGPYRMEVYDADGALVNMVTLTGITAGSGIFYVAGNAAADTEFGAGTTDVQFTFTLPANGQACFVRGTGGKIHCVAWGCVNTLAMANASTGASPPVDQSLSRQPTSQYHVTTPTPGANNGAGAADPACGTAPDAGPTPDADPGAPDAAGSGPDAGDGGGDDGGGCCRTGSRGPSGGALLLTVLALLAVTARRSARRS